jgi:hypothetical protein
MITAKFKYFGKQKANLLGPAALIMSVRKITVWLNDRPNQRSEISAFCSGPATANERMSVRQMR